MTWLSGRRYSHGRGHGRGRGRERHDDDDNNGDVDADGDNDADDDGENDDNETTLAALTSSPKVRTTVMTPIPSNHNRSYINEHLP